MNKQRIVNHLMRMGIKHHDIISNHTNSISMFLSHNTPLNAKMLGSCTMWMFNYDYKLEIEFYKHQLFGIEYDPSWRKSRKIIEKYIKFLSNVIDNVYRIKFSNMVNDSYDNSVEINLFLYKRKMQYLKRKLNTLNQRFNYDNQTH